MEIETSRLTLIKTDKYVKRIFIISRYEQNDINMNTYIYTHT